MNEEGWEVSSPLQESLEDVLNETLTEMGFISEDVLNAIFLNGLSEASDDSIDLSYLTEDLAEDDLSVGFNLITEASHIIRMKDNTKVDLTKDFSVVNYRGKSYFSHIKDAIRGNYLEAGKAFWINNDYREAELQHFSNYIHYIIQGIDTEDKKKAVLKSIDREIAIVDKILPATRTLWDQEAKRASVGWFTNALFNYQEKVGQLIKGVPILEVFFKSWIELSAEDRRAMQQRAIEQYKTELIEVKLKQRIKSLKALLIDVKKEVQKIDPKKVAKGEYA